MSFSFCPPRPSAYGQPCARHKRPAHPSRPPARVAARVALLMAVLMAVLAGGPAAAAEPPKIVVLGDSLVHGYGLLPEDGFVAQLQGWLDAQGIAAQLVNAGVSGDTTAGGLSRLGWVLGEDVDGLIVALGGNDALRGIDPDLSRANLDAILTEATGRGLPVLLVGITAPRNFGPDYAMRFEAIFPELAERHGALLYPDFMAALLRLPDRADTLARYYQVDGLHPNRAGVALIVQDIGPKVAELIARAGQ